MFLTRRPSSLEIEQFIEQSRNLALSYNQLGIANASPGGFCVDEASGVIGRGPQAFEHASIALGQWRHFDLGWVEQFPRGAAIEPGTTVAILVRHFGFYSLNGCRVVYRLDESESMFGFAYGTLTNHAEMGEEIFEVTFNPKSQEVVYGIRAVSKPRAALAKIGYPLTRMLQARFRRDSIDAMRAA